MGEVDYTRFHDELRTMMTLPASENPASRTQVGADDPFIGVNPKELIRLGDFLDSVDNDGCAPERSVFITGFEDWDRKAYILQEAAESRGMRFVGLDVGKFFSTPPQKSRVSPKKRILKLVNPGFEEEVLVCFSGVVKHFKPAASLERAVQREVLYNARQFATSVVDMKNDHKNLKICAIVDSPKGFPRSMQDEDVFGKNIKIDLPKLPARIEIISSVIGDIILSSMYSGEETPIDISDGEYVHKLGELTKDLGYNRIVAMVREAIISFEVEHSDPRNAQRKSLKTPSIKDLVQYVQRKF